MNLLRKFKVIDFVVELLTLEVGSRGFVLYDSFHHLQDAVGASKKELQDLLVSVSSAAIRIVFDMDQL